MTAPDSPPPPSHDQVVAEVQARLARIQDRDAARELVSAEVSRRPADECVDAAMAVLWPLVVRAREAAEAAEVVPADRDALARVVAELMSTADTRPEAVDAGVDRIVALFAPVLAEAVELRAEVDQLTTERDSLAVTAGDAVRAYETARRERDEARELATERHELLAGWVGYRERVRATRRGWCAALAEALGIDGSRMQPPALIEAVAEQRRELEEARRHEAVAEASEGTAWASSTDLAQRADTLSGLLRGVARRAGRLRRERNAYRESYIQELSNWRAATAANGLALETIAELRAELRRVESHLVAVRAALAGYRTPPVSGLDGLTGLAHREGQ